MIESNLPGVRYGWSVAGCGDVDGDGFDDVLASAPLYDEGLANQGIAYLHMGHATGLRQAPAWSFEGGQAHAFFGTVAGAGDVNGDGFDDLLLGSPDYDDGGSDSGRAMLFLGAPTGPADTPDWSWFPPWAEAEYGHCLGSAGDVDGDGYGDVFVGAPGFRDRGKVFVHHGSPAGLGGPDWSYLGTRQWAELGHGVGAGDVNGDGYDDLVVGEPFYKDPDQSGIEHGRVSLFLGSPGGLGAGPVWRVVGDQPGARLGYTVTAGGDVNGDGFEDVFVAATGYASPNRDEGRVYGFHGSASGLAGAPSWFVDSNRTYAQLGFSLALVDDETADGFDDLLVGSFGGHFARLYHGSPRGLHPIAVREMRLQGRSYFGNAVAAAGDVNGDGFPDSLIGAYQYSRNQTEEGALALYEGHHFATAWRRVPTSGAGPSSYAAAPPVLGRAWHAQVDVHRTGHAAALVVGHLDGGETRLPGGQTLLVAGPRLFALPLRPGPVAHWSAPIPNDPALYGLRLFTQAAHLLGDRPFRLTNAMDLILGF